MSATIGWSVDDGSITVDQTRFTADGGGLSVATNRYSARITSEHNVQPNFMAMVDMVTGAIADISDGVASIIDGFDLDNAVGVQLDILGQWIGQSRIVSNILIPGFFGFADNVAASTFGELGNKSIGGRFYELGEAFGGSTILSDPDYRTILRARIVRNQSHGSIADIENALQYVFGVGCTVTDNSDMTISIHVTQPVTPTDQALLNSLDLLPRPAGVRIASITFTT